MKKKFIPAGDSNSSQYENIFDSRNFVVTNINVTGKYGNFNIITNNIGSQRQSIMFDLSVKYEDSKDVNKINLDKLIDELSKLVN